MCSYSNVITFTVTISVSDYDLKFCNYIIVTNATQLLTVWESACLLSYQEFDG